MTWGVRLPFASMIIETAFVHKSIDVRIHSLSGGGAERAGRFSDRGFGGTCVVDGVIFKVVWHGFAVL